MAPSVVLAPLGLFHSDHRLASDACLAARRPGMPWLLYEDAIYRRIPGIVDERLHHLARTGVVAASVERVHAPSPDKRAALTCYASQLRARARPKHPGWEDALAPERY